MKMRLRHNVGIFCILAVALGGACTALQPPAQRDSADAMAREGSRRAVGSVDWPSLNTTEQILKTLYLPPMALDTQLADAVGLVNAYLKVKCPIGKRVTIQVDQKVAERPVRVTFYCLSVYEFLDFCAHSTETDLVLSGKEVGFHNKDRKTDRTTPPTVQ